MTVNLDKLNEAWAYLKSHENIWNQKDYIAPLPGKLKKWDPTQEDWSTWRSKPVEIVPEGACNTSFCLAGFVGLLNDFPSPTQGQLDEGSWFDPRTGESIADFAERVLGLTPLVAAFMFQSRNKLEHLEFGVNMMNENPDITTDEFVIRFEEFCNDHPLDDDEDEDWDEEDDDY